MIYIKYYNIYFIVRKILFLISINNSNHENLIVNPSNIMFCIADPS